jgi:hypothetical protein
MELKITKERILEAASTSTFAKETLKTLFPDVFEEEFWELKIKENKEIYFVNTLTNQSFNVGDEITIKDPNFRSGDYVRNHTISGFSLQFGKLIKNSKNKKVYAHFKGYDFERALLLNQIIKL